MPDLKDSVQSLTDLQLSNVKIERIRAEKLIRDALTATSTFDKHEIAILDLPILQRLRRIHQTGLAFLTYPCATHNRFQHSIGVTNIVDKLARGLGARKEYERLMDEKTLRELRLAALLHDVGHGPFSHPSEEVIEHFPEVESALGLPKFSKSKPHEMISYYVVTSNAFRKIIDKINADYRINIDVDRVANMIVGDMDDPSREGYLSDLINGPFDADKLDYMPRDAYFAGLKMEVDLDRIAYTCHVDVRANGNARRLCADISGAHNLEQILFNKILLYSSIYHHHKVRAAVCMLKSIFEIIRDCALSIDGLTFQQASDFLSVDDYDLISRFGSQKELASVISNVKNRQLLKRALVISRKTVKDPRQYQRLIRLSEDPSELREVRTLITDEINANGGSCTEYDIWVDFPDPPSLREPSQCLVRLTETDFVPLKDIFPADWWLIAYGETKWKGHVFCPPQAKIRKLANEASIKVLKNTLGVEFQKTATVQAKMQDDL